MDTIVILYLVLLAFLIMCMASVFLVAAVDKVQSYRDFKRFLIAVILAYCISFVFGNSPIPAAYIFAFQFFPMYFLSNYLLNGQVVLSFKNLLIVHLSGALLTTILIQLTDNFTIFSLPIVLTAYSPGFSSIFYLLKRKKTLTNLFYAFVMVLGAANYLSFSLFRFVPGTEMWGWSSAVLNYILVMYCFFLIILDKKVVLDNELKSELKLTNTLYKSLIHDTSNDLNYLSFSLSRAIKRGDISFVEKANERLNELIRFKTEIRKQYQNNKSISHKLSVKHVFERIDNTYKNLYLQKNIELEKLVHHDFNDVHIPVSEDVLIKTLLGNLLSNALKFSPEGKKVSLEFDIIEENVVIKVTDSGLGIPESIIRDVKSYSKVTSSKVTRQELGTGMGLGIVCFIIDRIHGETEFITKNNKGTCIVLKIPFVESKEISIKPTEASTEQISSLQ